MVQAYRALVMPGLVPGIHGNRYSVRRNSWMAGTRPAMTGICESCLSATLLVAKARMTQTNYALRLQASIKAEAERLAKAEGTTLNQFINVAVAEKVAVLRTADFFRERVRRADLPSALALLNRLGNDDPPQPGDELE
jgi:hypothetical protein